MSYVEITDEIKNYIGDFPEWARLILLVLIIEIILITTSKFIYEVTNKLIESRNITHLRRLPFARTIEFASLLLPFYFVYIGTNYSGFHITYIILFFIVIYSLFFITGMNLIMGVSLIAHLKSIEARERD